MGVYSYKMTEIERLAGGMKARERALEEAYQTMRGGFPGPSSSQLGYGNFMGSSAEFSGGYTPSGMNR